MNREMTLMMRLQADASRMINAFMSGERGVKRLVNTAKSEFTAFKTSINSLEGRLASLGVTVGIVATDIQSARMDKSLTQIGQTADMSREEIAGLRRELFEMSKETGQNVDELKDGFNNAVQAGLKLNEAKNVIDATNKAMAVTGAQANILTDSLTVAGTAYNFDLTKPKLALGLLDKMTVAGRLGNAELENLSSIFSRVGPNAASAGMGFEQTLGFIEGLSKIERQPERLATLADSTLRLFNNLEYMKNAQKATGVKFFNADGSRRDAFKVVEDIKKKYDTLNTEKEQAVYIQKAFGKADLDTIKGMRVLLNGDMLKTIREFSGEIATAGGTIERDLPAAISNAVDQSGRLKSTLREAADGFAQPINDSIQRAIKYTLDSKEKGGMGMDGNDLLLAGGGAALSGILLKRYGPKMLQKLGGGIAGLGAGVATGKALENAAGVMPVYVVNMPATLGGESSLPGMPIKDQAALLKKKPDALKNSWMTAAMMKNLGLAVAPFAAMYGATEWAGDTSNDVGRVQGLQDFSSILNKIFSYDPDAKQKAWREKQDRELNGTLDVHLHDDRAPTVQFTSNQPGLKVSVDNGQHMSGG